MGVYDNGQDYYSDQPTEPTIFTVFTDEFSSSTCGAGAISKISGRCEECPAYTYPDMEGKTCVSDEGKCKDREVLNLRGKCEECPLYTYPDELQLNCIDDKEDCTELQILNTEGKC